jgi:predicted alpha/beta hydrolase family esterase
MLSERGIQAYVPEMSDPEEPSISEWVPYLSQNVGGLDEDTYFIGHRVGCQAILR